MLTACSFIAIGWTFVSSVLIEPCEKMILHGLCVGMVEVEYSPGIALLYHIVK